MLAKSIYIVHSKIIGLGEKPFLEKHAVRPAFRSMFTNPHCFTDLHTLFYDDDNPTSLPSKPFLKGLGQVCIRARSLNLKAKRVRYQLGRIVTGREKYWEPGEKLSPVSDFYFDGSDFGFQRGDVFGIDPLLQDQRMNFLHFDLFKPVHIKAVHEHRTLAQGKIFLHLYPSGFVYYFVAISLYVNYIESVNELREAFKEMRPSYQGTWVWKSRLGNDRLEEICTRVQELSCDSILTPPSVVRESPWRSFAKIVQPDQSLDFTKLFIKGKFDRLSLNHLPNEGEHEFDELISSNQGFLLLMSDRKWRTDSLTLFWKLSTILEYICLLDFVYKDYVAYLKREIVQLKEYRLSFMAKVEKDDFLRMTAYDRNLLKFVQAMAGHIHTTTGFYRRVFSSYWNGIEFGKHKETFRRVVVEWEDEVSKWDNTFAAVYKKLIALIKALFGR